MGKLNQTDWGTTSRLKFAAEDKWASLADHTAEQHTDLDLNTAWWIDEPNLRNWGRLSVLRERGENFVPDFNFLRVILNCCFSKR